MVEIISILYGTNEETVGIGKKIEEEPFINQIIGLTPEDPIEAGTDIDVISQATISSTAMARSVRATMDKFAANYLGR
jgi:Na+-translocating ferredoxin:NAD+ oxidoreductase subunit G